MKKFLFFLFAAISIFTLSSCGSIGVELIEPYSYYPNGYYNPYGTVIYYDTPVFTRYSYPPPPPPRPHCHHHHR